ncbi:MAG: CARDB domain-containing protein [Planctomycetota bacterium]
MPSKSKKQGQGEAWPVVVVVGLAVGLALILGGCGGGGADAGAGSQQNPNTGPTPVNSDLEALSLEVTEASVVAGQGIHVALVARNNGPDAAPAFRMGVYLSTDEVFDAADVRLGYWSEGGLAALAEASAGGSLVVPLSTLAASWRVLLAVDDLGALGEPDETNNVVVAALPLAVTPPELADLEPVGLSFLPFSVQAGTAVEVSDSVQNVGVDPAGAFRVGVYLSSDDQITTSDVLLGYRTLVSLDPAVRDDAVGDLTVPATLPPGNYFVGLIVDDLDEVLEANEGDNVATAGVLLQVSAAPTTDLAATAISFSPSSVDVGGALIVEETVRNDGLVDAQAFQVGVYLSQDVVIDPAEDVLLGFRTLPSLASGASSPSGAVALTVPTSVEAGLWFVGVIADHTNLIPDSNRLNNTRVALAQVDVSVPPLPDLVAAEVSFSPSSVVPGAGGVLQVDQLVRNIGPVAATEFRVGVYLSDNSVISASDVLLGSRTLSSLGSGSSSGASSGFTLPSGLSTGSYYVGLVVDDLGAQSELSEGNNLLLATGILDVTTAPTPMPNLVMEVVDPNITSVQPGYVVQIVSRVKNTGTASANGSFRVGFYLSTDSTITTDDVFVGDRLVPFGLGINFTSVASVPVTIPSNTAGGTYRLGAIADWTQQIAESNETDNALAQTGPLTVTIPMPNLRVSAVSLSTSGVLQAGDTFELDHTVRNQGTLAAGGFRVGIYLTSNTTLDRTADILVESRTVGSLGTSSNNNAVTTVAVPAGLAAGQYYVGVYVDDLDEVTEQDEDDNTRVTTGRVTVQ